MTSRINIQIVNERCLNDNTIVDYSGYVTTISLLSQRVTIFLRIHFYNLNFSLVFKREKERKMHFLNQDITQSRPGDGKVQSVNSPWFSVFEYTQFVMIRTGKSSDSTAGTIKCSVCWCLTVKVYFTTFSYGQSLCGNIHVLFRYLKY